jgi:hypothetical protein
MRLILKQCVVIMKRRKFRGLIGCSTQSVPWKEGLRVKNLKKSIRMRIILI